MVEIGLASGVVLMMIDCRDLTSLRVLMTWLRQFGLSLCLMNCGRQSVRASAAAALAVLTMSASGMR